MRRPPYSTDTLCALQLGWELHLIFIRVRIKSDYIREVVKKKKDEFLYKITETKHSQWEQQAYGPPFVFFSLNNRASGNRDFGYSLAVIVISLWVMVCDMTVIQAFWLVGGIV